MNHSELIPHLFRTEYRKITSVLCKAFGIAHLAVAEDIASDTFLLATETWGQKGLPENPVAWLYAVSKNKAKDYLKRQNHFAHAIAPELKPAVQEAAETDIDLSDKNIFDSQLQMMFAICHPCLSTSAQIGLSLRILCGFGIEEIADAFLSSKETINKRLFRAREKLRAAKINIALPGPVDINNRLQNVLTTLYLMFNEGYCSQSQDTTLRKDLCLEAMRLTFLLTEAAQTNLPPVNALLSLMCFHTSRFEARINNHGEIILYEAQDEKQWNEELIARGEYYLSQAAQGPDLSTYHLEAAIAYWHTHKTDSQEKWEHILQLYNRLLLMAYSPIAALNRTYALSKTNGKQAAIAEAEKLNLQSNHLYHSLLANLYTGIDTEKALGHLEKALATAKSAADKSAISKNIHLLRGLGTAPSS